MKKLIAIALILIAFVGGYAVGRHNTIISASLYDIADDGSILVVMSDTRADESADEVLVFKLSGF